MAKKPNKKLLITTGPLTSIAAPIIAVAPINNHGLGIKPLITTDPKKEGK